MNENHENGKLCPPPPPPDELYDDWLADGSFHEYQPTAFDDYEPPTSSDYFVPSSPAYLDECPIFDFDEYSPTAPPPHQPNITPPIRQDSARPSPSPLPSTITEYLDNLFKWPRLDPNAIIDVRPPTTSAQLRSMRVSVRQISLTEGQYASHVLTFRQIQNAAFDGGCGTGKSTLATQHRDPFIFIAPTTLIVDQQGSETCQIIKANVEPDFEKYQQFTVTYDSLPRLCHAAIEAGLNPYLVPIFVDEAQHLLSDSFKSRRLDNCMYELRKFKFVTMASATLPPYIPYFEYLQIISIKKANVKVIKWSYVIGSDVAWIENRLTSGQFVLYHLNDKKRIETIASHFASLGFTTKHIDADNKDEMMQSGLKDKRLPHADLYLCTSVFNDGISVHKHAQNYDVIISKASALHLGPLENVQVTQRFRDKAPDNLFIMRQTNEFNDDIIFSEKMYKQRYEQLVGRAERQAARMTEEYREEVAWLSQESKQLLNDSQEILEKLFPLKDDSFFIFNENKQIIEVNLRAIGEHVYSYLQRVCYSSRYMMEHWLGQHGFRFGEIIEVGQESELEKDLIKTTKNLSDADREVIRKTIACFESYDDALKASQEQIAMTYNEAASLLPFKEFVEDKKEEPQEEESQEEDQKKKQEKLREEYRVALREKVKESQIKQKAGQILREHISILCMDGTKFKDAFAIAQRELVSSTLTGKALKHLKYKTQLQAIAKGVRNPELEKVLESAFIEEVLQAIIINEPLIEDEVNACFENAFIHSDRARERFTVTPKAPKDGELTEGEIQKAARKQWRIRKEFLNYFFEMERIRKTIDGKRVNVWIPIKTLY